MHGVCVLYLPPNFPTASMLRYPWIKPYTERYDPELAQ